jgi:hypothetical protein
MEMKVIPISEIEVKSTKKSLKSTNSTGYDGISNKIFKQRTNYISKDLICTCNCSVNSRIFRKDVNLRSYSTFIKKRKRTEINNYRPLLLLLLFVTVSKSLEVISPLRLDQHLKPNNILTNEQFEPIPLAEQSNVSVYGRSLAVIAGSNPAGGMDICLL